VGDFESFGMKEVLNVTAGSALQVWVEDYWLSSERVSALYLDRCGPRLR
jgi:hypothetical protein